jgi:hypothetical protein
MMLVECHLIRLCVSRKNILRDIDLSIGILVLEFFWSSSKCSPNYHASSDGLRHPNVPSIPSGPTQRQTIF